MAEFSISNIEISTPNKKRKKYSLEFKKEIALAAIKTNNLTVARDNDICESNVRLWRKDLPKIEQAIKDSSDEKNSAKKFRIDQGGGGCGKFPVNLELERYLREKFMEDHYSKGLSLSVTRKNLMSIALQSPLAKEGFKASPGWCNNFIKRQKRNALPKNDLDANSPEYVFENSLEIDSNLSSFVKKEETEEDEETNDFSTCNCKDFDKLISTHYCEICNEGFCTSCVKSHERFKMTKTHDLQRIIDYYCKCQTEENILAVKYCNECSEVFCNDCIDAHQKFIVTRKHILYSI